MDKKAVRLRICDLLDICQTCEKHNYKVRGTERCNGCQVYEELVLLRKNIDRPAKKKFEPILAKGQDMTKSDIATLLENGIQKAVIKKALGIGNETIFYDLLAAFGFVNRRKKEGKDMALTVDEFIQLHYVEKKKIIEIAEMKGKDVNAVYAWKSYNKEKIEKALAEQGIMKEVPVKKEINWKAKYKKLEIEFQNQSEAIDFLKQEIKTLLDKQKLSDAENINAACDDIENELASVQEENSKLTEKIHEINQLLIHHSKLETENKLMAELLKVKL